MPVELASPQFYKHPHFDLMLPSNSTLTNLVALPVIERTVRHEWPLSCVEKVVFEGGLAKYCKTTRPPSMEIQVYSSLKSPLLVPHLVVARSDSSSSLLLDSFNGEQLPQNAIDSVGFAQFLDDLKNKLSSISDSGPTFLDFSHPEKIREHMTLMLERLNRIYGPVSSRPIDPALLAVANSWATSKEIQDAIIEGAVYSNGDLSADNILVRGEETRIVDWQFPRIASLKVEVVNLLTSLNIDPRMFLPNTVIVAGLLCKVRWLAECADIWLPKSDYHTEIGNLLRQVAELTSRA